MALRKYRGNTSNLVSLTEKNYEQAISYYSARKRNFLNQINLEYDKKFDIKEAEENFTNQINDYVLKKWNEFYDSIIQNITERYGKIDFKTGTPSNNKDNKQNSEIVKESILAQADNCTELGISKELIESLANSSSEYGNTGIFAILGHIYEKYLTKFFNNCADSIKNSIDASVSDVLSSLVQFGDDKNIKGIRAKGSQNITDIGFSTNKNEKAKSEVTSFDATLSIKGNRNIMKNSAILDYIEGKNINQFGINVKNWQGDTLNAQHLTQSSFVKNEINKGFKSSSGKTWNLQYAQGYANLCVSKYLLSIIGATNIMLITRTKLYWFDDILKTQMLYMKIQSDGLKDEEAISPNVYDNYIYFRNRQRMNKMLLTNNSISLENNKSYKNNDDDKPYTFSFSVKKLK